VTAALLEATGLAVERGGQPVLDVPAFRVAERELVALIGPNGSGKSTLLLALMGLLERRAGTVLFRGAALGAASAAVEVRRRMALVLQEPLLFDTTVRDNVAAGLRLRGVGRDEVRRRVAAALERFHLGALGDRAARKLSGGEARRVNLARALVTEPEVVLLDEPFAGLDVPTRQAITDDLERALRDAGTAAVLVTHDQSEALRLADRIDVMRAGRIVQSDVPSAVLNHPVDPFVASVMGIETVVDGHVRASTAGAVAVKVNGFELAAVGEAEPGEAVYVCIRPEHVLIEVVDPARTSSARNVFPARIAGVAAVGGYLKVRLDCGFPLVAHVTTESYAALQLGPGKAVFASFKATAIHLIRRGRAPAPPASS
jgi:tungstate transport system ATP-binding protein